MCDDLFLALLFPLIRYCSFFWTISAWFWNLSLSQSSHFFRTIFWPARRVRIKYSQSAFIFVIHLNPKRAKGFIQRSGTNLSNVLFTNICLKKGQWRAIKMLFRDAIGRSKNWSFGKGCWRHGFIIIFKQTKDGFQLFWICWGSSEEMHSQQSLRNLSRDGWIF